jgi:hypothetical protein
MRRKLSFQGAFQRDDADLPFRHLPFEVPVGARRLEVTYHFEQAEQEPSDVVDIGVFDERGTDFLAGGFRGWSGSSRSGLFIAHQDATPGYIPGPLGPGLWHVHLGCPLKHRDRCRYWVELSLDIDLEADVAETTASVNRPEPGLEPRPSQSRQGAGRWYAGDFHCHTVHSDGLNTVDECAVEAARQGLDFLAITDHNTIAHFEEIALRPRDGVLLIPGEEVTTAWGHANVWGAGCWVDFRCADDRAMERVLSFVDERGGLLSVNHPKRGYPWEFTGVEDFRVTEVWQGPWRFLNTESLDYWEQRLRSGRRLIAVGGSDCHSIPPAEELQPWSMGNPCTMVYVEGALDEAGVLGAVRAGHVFISEDPKGPFLELTAACGERSYLMGDVIDAPAGTPVRFRLRYRGPAEKKLRLLRDGDLWRETVAEQEETSLEFDALLEEPGYLRAEVMGFRGRPERGEVVHAMTNPLYLSPEAT